MKGQEARDLWNAAKRNWINCHPKVERVPGDPASDPSKCDTSAYGGGGSGAPSGGSTGGTTGTPKVGLCNAFESLSSPPQGYGAAWNTQNNINGLFLNSRCEADGSVKYAAGVPDYKGGTMFYVYSGGYYYGGGWKPFTLAGSAVQGSTAWLHPLAEYLNKNPPAGDHFWVSYVCQWINNTWKCGCRDAACTTNYWMLQGVKR